MRHQTLLLRQGKPHNVAVQEVLVQWSADESAVGEKIFPLVPGGLLPVRVDNTETDSVFNTLSQTDMQPSSKWEKCLTTQFDLTDLKTMKLDKILSLKLICESWLSMYVREFSRSRQVSDYCFLRPGISTRKRGHFLGWIRGHSGWGPQMAKLVLLQLSLVWNKLGIPINNENSHDLSS